MGKKYGKEAQQRVLQDVNWDYNWGRRRNFYQENDLLHANKGYEGNSKAALVLYGLGDLIGEDSLNAALQEFRNAFAFRSGGVYAGSYDLYRVLQKHVPDSFRYYLEDRWEKGSFDDNKVVEVSAVPLGKNDEYKVSLVVEVKKTYIDSAGKERAAAGMNDYIDIGVYGADPKGSPGKGSPPLYLKKQWLGAGKHRIELIGKGKPAKAGIDPESKIMDPIQDDNM